MHATMTITSPDLWSLLLAGLVLLGFAKRRTWRRPSRQRSANRPTDAKAAPSTSLGSTPSQLSRSA